MKQVRFPSHTLLNLKDRKIRIEDVEQTLQEPEYIVDGYDGRKVYMRLFDDTILKQKMLLRVIIEEQINELIVVTVYKTSQFERYLKGLSL